VATRRFIVIDRRDNVATAVQTLPAREVLDMEAGTTADRASGPLTLCEAIPFGHKFALRPIPARGPVIKYGETAGLATEDIEAGQHVHVHNVEGIKGRGDKKAAASR
jgi:altronate dehydratase small subunit